MDHGVPAYRVVRRASHGTTREPGRNDARQSECARLKMMAKNP